MWKKIVGLITDAATYGASSVVSQIAGFLLLPIYTRHLSPEDYGVMAMLAIVTAVYLPFANLGIQNAIFLYFSRTKDPVERKRVLSTGLIAVTIGSIVVFAGAMTLGRVLTDKLLGEGHPLDLINLNLLGAAVTSISTVPTSVLRAERRVRATALLNIARLLLSMAATIYLVVAHDQGVRGVLLGTLIGEVVVTAIQLRLTQSSFGLIVDRELLKKMLSYGLPFVPSRLFGTAFTYFGQYILAKRLSLDEAGLYGVALKFTTPITFIVNSVQQAWVPYKFQVYEDEKDPAPFFRSVTTYYVAMLAYLWVGVSVWGPEVLRVFTDARYHTAAELVPWLGLIPVTMGIRLMLGTGIEMSDDTKPLPFIMLAGLVATAASTFVTVPSMGGRGAALSTAIGWLVMAAVMLPVARSRFRIDYDWVALVGLLLLSIACVATGLMVQQFALEVRLGAALGLSALFPLIIYALLLRSTTERARVQRLVKRLRQRLTGTRPAA